MAVRVEDIEKSREATDRTREMIQAASQAPPVESSKPTWPARKEELEDLVAEGLSNREIAERYGVTAANVSVRLSSLGIRRTDAQRRALKAKAGKASAVAKGKRSPDPAELKPVKVIPDPVQEAAPPAAPAEELVGQVEPIEAPAAAEAIVESPLRELVGQVVGYSKWVQQEVLFIGDDSRAQRLEDAVAEFLKGVEGRRVEIRVRVAG